VTDTASPIVTPEAVVLDFETAGVGSRCIAKLLDVLIQLTGLLIVSLLLAFGVGAAGAGGDLATILIAVTTFLILIGYPVISETLWNGKTMGKSVMGLRAVTREGAPIRFRHASIRGIIGIVEIYAFGFIAVFTAALSRSNQRVGDLAGGTIVIRERAAVHHAVSLTFYVPPGYETYAASLDVSGLDAQEYQLIRSFLTRVLQLSPEARMAMALRLANPVAVAIDHSPPAGIGPELFLVCVASAYQQRHGGGAPSWGTPAWPATQPGWGPPSADGYGWGPGGQPPYAAPSPAPPGGVPPASAMPGYAPPSPSQPVYAPPGYGSGFAGPAPYAAPPPGPPAPPSVAPSTPGFDPPG